MTAPHTSRFPGWNLLRLVGLETFRSKHCGMRNPVASSQSEASCQFQNDALIVEDKCAFIEMLVSSMDFRLLYGVHSQHKQSSLELHFSCPRSGQWYVQHLILFTNFLPNAPEFCTMRSLKWRSLRAINCLSGWSLYCQVRKMCCWNESLRLEHMRGLLAFTVLGGLRGPVLSLIWHI